jgi:hypothetical protein
VYKNQTYDKCKYFGIRNLCPHIEEEIMKQFVLNTEIPESSVSVPLNFDKADEVNKICMFCIKFEHHKDSE